MTSGTFFRNRLRFLFTGAGLGRGWWKSCSLRRVGQLHNIKLKLRNFSRCEWGCGFKPTPSLLLYPFFTSLSLIVCHVYAWGLLNVHVQTNPLLEFITGSGTTGTCITFADRWLGWGWGLSISFLFMMCLRCNIHFYILNSFDWTLSPLRKILDPRIRIIKSLPNLYYLVALLFQALDMHKCQIHIM